MIGDKLVITTYHKEAAAFIYEAVESTIKGAEKPVAITIAGESGCGKSETAKVLADLLTKAGYRAIVLQQDDYFVYPPQTNHQKRLEDIKQVGPGEVKLDLLDENIAAIKKGNLKEITKPLVDYDQDLIMEETVPLEGIKAIVIDGTYTTSLKNADFRAFIDRNYRQTKMSRLKRSRDPLSSYLERVLAIEHEIISNHKKMADLVIPAPLEEQKKVDP